MVQFSYEVSHYMRCPTICSVISYEGSHHIKCRWYSSHHTWRVAKSLSLITCVTHVPVTCVTHVSSHVWHMCDTCVTHLSSDVWRMCRVVVLRVIELRHWAVWHMCWVIVLRYWVVSSSQSLSLVTCGTHVLSHCAESLSCVTHVLSHCAALLSWQSLWRRDSKTQLNDSAQFK